MQPDEQPTITQAEFQRLKESDPGAAFRAYAAGQVEGSHIRTPEGREQMEQSRRMSKQIAEINRDSFSTSMSGEQMRTWADRMGLQSFAPVAPTDAPNDDDNEESPDGY